MTNLIYQDKINRQLQVKLIRQSTRKKVRNMEKICLQFVTWGGAVSKYISNKITFFHYDIRAG